MGFTDLLSSSRGPGIIGTLLALLVLVGFGTLYLFVFDEGLQGGKKTIQSVIREQGMQIESNKMQIASFKERIAEGELFKTQAQDFSQLKARTELAVSRLEELTAEKTAAEEAAAAADSKWEEYKDEYRAATWAKAEGEKLGEIKGIKSGKVYTDVVIRKVDHTGMDITDSTGPKSIDSEDLPLALQDRFQFDEDKKEEQEKKDDELENNHVESVEIALALEKANKKIQQKNELNAGIRRAQEAIKQAKANDIRAQNAIARQRSEISQEKSKRGGVSHAPQMEVELRRMQEAQKTNRASIGANEKSNQEAKRTIATLDREIGDLKMEIAKMSKEIKDKQAAKAAAAEPAVPGATQ